MVTRAAASFILGGSLETQEVWQRGKEAAKRYVVEQVITMSS